MLSRFAPTGGGFCPARWKQGRGGSKIQGRRGQRLPLAQAGWVDLSSSRPSTAAQARLGGATPPGRAASRHDTRRAGSAFRRVAPWHLECAAQDAHHPEKKRRGTKSAASGNEEGFCAFVSGTCAAACSRSTLMNVALRHQLRGVTGMPPEERACMGCSLGTEGRARP